MRNIILLTAFLLGLFIIIINWQRPSSEDELAYRMSRSENFRAILDFWKTTAGSIPRMSDSNKFKFRALRSRMSALFQKNNGLTQSQIRDSMNMINDVIKTNALIDSSFLKKSEAMAPVYKRLHDEFPEYIKLPAKNRSKVFRKAFALLKKRNA